MQGNKLSELQVIYIEIISIKMNRRKQRQIIV